MLLSIIIVNYNVANLLSNCIESILQFISLKEEYEIIVFDNNSPERDVEQLQEKFPKVKFIFSNENLGFAKANNYAFTYSKGEFILFLNPDTLVSEDFINPIINFIKKNSEAGACGPMLLNEDKSYQNSTGIKLGYIYEFSEAFMVIGFLRFIYRKLLFNKMKKQNPVKVSWLSAACMVVSREVIEKINGFSHDFFLNYEDIDLCLRISEQGYSNYYFHKLKCIHLDQKSQTKDFEKFVFNRYKSRLVYSKKHYNFVKRYIINFFHIIGLYLRLITAPFFYSRKEFVERSKGYKDSIKLYFK